VDYDAEGRVIFSGRSEADADVRGYVDNRPMVAGRSSSRGEWRLQPSDPIPPGTYTVRVDHVDAAGRVVARAEIPFKREEPRASPAGDPVIVIQPGNNLWTIARRTYGRGIQYVVIYQANQQQIRDPDLIYPGQIFKLPTMQN
jgi:nucleoid-associated protein YgaU